MQFKGRKKHMNGVSKNGKLSLLFKTSQIIHRFHVVHLQRRIRLCMFFLMSTQLSVRMIPPWLQGRNQSSRKLRHLRDGRCRKVSTLIRNLQGLIGAPVQPPPPTTPRPGAAQPEGLSLPLAATPMTTSHPPRPPIEALPKHVPMETSQGANKHPLEPPPQQGPPNKHVRHKAFPFEQPPPASTSMASPSAVDMSRQGTPSPKGPPASYMPTPPEVKSMSTSAPAAVPEGRMTDNGKYRTIRSATDIDWTRPLHEQLEPNLKGGPRSSTTFEDLCMLRAKIPKLSKQVFDDIFPSDNIITVVQKSRGVHRVHMSEAAAWVLNATHWFSLLKQPMMIVIWCHDWEDASKFQYLMQILQVQFHDYVPRYQIFMFDDAKIYKLIQKWQEPTTVWNGQPVLGFREETFLDDLQVIGFKDFSPMWTCPTTSVNQCWDPITFGMAPWHLNENTDKQKSKEALQSQSPIAAFKACNMIQALGIAYSKIVLPNGDSKAESKGRTYCPTTWNYSYQWTYASQ